MYKESWSYQWGNKWCFETNLWVPGATEFTATELFMVSFTFLVDRELRYYSVGRERMYCAKGKLNKY